MRYTWVFLILSTFAGNLLAANPQTKATVPDAAAISVAEKALHELFKADYGRARPSDPVAVAKKLLAEANKVNDDPAARYVLLRDARDFSASGGDALLTIQVTDQIIDDYAVSPLRTTEAALEAVAPSVSTSWASAAVTLEALWLLDDAIDADDFTLADKASQLAERFGARSGSTIFAAEAAYAKGRARHLRLDYDRAKQAETQLAKDPRNPSASLVAGKYRCFGKGHWEAGLPLLVQSSDQKLASLARDDLANPTDASAQKRIGDLWWDEAEKDKADGPATKSRAVYWYGKAVGGMTGLAALAIQRRIDEFKESGATLTVDLLALSSPTEDSVAGTWTRTKNGLTCGGGQFERLQFPYIPPEEYDFALSFTRPGGNELGQIIRFQKQGLFWGMGGGYNTKVHFADVSPKVEANFVLQKAHAYTSVVRVRDHDISGSVDGKVLCHFDPTTSQMSLNPDLAIRNSEALGLGTWESATTFTSVTVTEVNRHGRLTH